MPDIASVDLTRVLAEMRAGDQSARDRLVETVYGHLRALAGNCMRRHPPGQTLEPTALVHEAFMRLVDQSSAPWQDRAHFFAASATVMRGILADHARRRAAAKRGGGWKRIDLTNIATPSGESVIDLLDLDRALDRLAALHERQARIVEFRFFAGMTEEEVAQVLGVSRSTVSGEWKMARAWLSANLAGHGSP